VLHTFGAGNCSTRPELLSAFREAADRGVIIVNVTQCAKGAVAPDTYATGRVLAA
jgi:lysophospholipase